MLKFNKYAGKWSYKIIGAGWQKDDSRRNSSGSAVKERTLKDKQKDVYKNRLTLQLIDPIRIDIIQRYQKKQKNYLKFLEAKTLFHKGLLRRAYKEYYKYSKRK